MTTKSIKPNIHEIVNNNLKEQWVNVDNWLTSLHQLVRNGSPIDAAQKVVAANGVKVKSDYKELLIRIESSTGSPITITANPQISQGGIDGQRITLEGASGTGHVELTDGNGLKLAGAASFNLELNDMLTLRYNKSQDLWLEVSRSKNT